MSIGSRVFWLPRKGHSPLEYEDAFAAADDAGRYALADGASEGCFTDLWARLLVEDFVHQADGVEQWLGSLPAVQRRWDADVRARKIPWHAAPGVEQGAHAAFLGLVLNKVAKSGESFSPGACAGEIPAQVPGLNLAFHWQAVAVGDTCLFHTRNGLLLRAFPLEHSKQFGNVPKLVGARMPSHQIQEKQQFWTDGQGQPGDRLWAMTDALARWCLVEQETGQNPWLALESAIPPSPTCRTRQDERGAGGEGSRLDSRSISTLCAARDAGGERNDLPSRATMGTWCPGRVAAMQSPGEGLFPAWIAGLRASGRLHNDDVTLLAIEL